MRCQYSLQEIQERTGIDPENLRDWRRRGLLEGVGTLQENGRWSYRVGDVLLLAIAVHLVRQSGLHLAHALKIAAFANPPLWCRASHEAGRYADQQRAIRFLVAWSNEENGVVQVEWIRDLNNIPAFGQAHSHLIDLDALAKSLSPIISRLAAERHDAVTATAMRSIKDG